MKRDSKIYTSFLILGLTPYLAYYCILSQANYWTRFYDKRVLTLYAMIFTTAEFLGGILAAPFDKKWNSRTFALVNFIVESVCLVSLIPCGYIPNMIVKTVITAIPIAIYGVGSSMFYSSLIASSSRVGPLYSTAIQIGAGLSSIAV